MAHIFKPKMSFVPPFPISMHLTKLGQGQTLTQLECSVKYHQNDYSNLSKEGTNLILKQNDYLYLLTKHRVL